jgi:prepilin-type N-terminal cleavage/methylation domain-containing protein
MTDPRRAIPARRAFTLIDVLVTLAVMSIVILAAIPAFTPDERTRLVAASNLLIADLNNARAMSVQDPADPVRLVIGVGGANYFLARESAPTDAIELPIGVGGKYAVLFGQGEHIDLADVQLAPDGVDPDSIAADDLPFIRFDAFGRLSPQTDVRLIISAGTPTLTVVIRADTGDAYVE